MTEKAQENTQAVMPASKNTKEFKSEITGKKYIFQKVAPIAWLDVLDDVESGDQKTKRRRLYGAVMENIVVSPQMELSEFDDFAEMELVVTNAIRFQQGKQ